MARVTKNIPKNILVFTSLFPNACDPTLGIFVENRLRHLLQDTDNKATVIAPVPWFPFRHRLFGRYARAAATPRHEVRHGLDIYHPRFLVIPKLGMHLTPWFLYRAGLRAARSLLKQGRRFDLMDVHYLYPDGVSAAMLANKLHLPFVMTARGSDVTEIGLMPGPKQRILAAVRRAWRTITVSDSLRRQLIDLGAAADKIETLRNGVDANQFRETRRAEMRAAWGFRGPVIVFAGWLIDRKRVDVVLDVVSALPQLSAVIAGDGPLRAVLEAQARTLGIEARVRFIGQQAPADMPAVMSGADILMLPSMREGWANVLLEAMACGTPVIARAVGAAPDLVCVPEAGRVVDGDAREFARAVSDLLAHYPDRAIVRQYAEKFGWRETSLGQDRIFDGAVADGHAVHDQGQD